MSSEVGPLRIGCAGVIGEGFQGCVRNVRYWSGARTQTDVRDAMHASTPAIVSGDGSLSNDGNKSPSYTIGQEVKIFKSGLMGKITQVEPATTAGSSNTKYKITNVLGQIKTHFEHHFELAGALSLSIHNISSAQLRRFWIQKTVF